MNDATEVDNDDDHGRCIIRLYVLDLEMFTMPYSHRALWISTTDISHKSVDQMDRSHVATSGFQRFFIADIPVSSCATGAIVISRNCSMQTVGAVVRDSELCPGVNSDRILNGCTPLQ